MVNLEEGIHYEIQLKTSATLRNVQQTFFVRLVQYKEVKVEKIEHLQCPKYSKIEFKIFFKKVLFSVAH